MAKKKDSVALFEVINKGRQQRDNSGMNVPAWMGDRQQDAEGEYRSSDGSANAGTGPPPLPAARRYGGGKPAVSVEPGRVHLSLTYVTGAMILGAFAVLMIGVFWLGRATAPTPPVAAADTGQPPLNPDVIKPERHHAGAPGGQTPPIHTPRRKGGKYYLIIYNTMGRTARHKDDARDIARHCSQNGHAADTLPTKSGDWLVLSYREFDSDRSEESLAFAGKIKRLVGNYIDSSDRYKASNRRGAISVGYYKWKKD